MKIEKKEAGRPGAAVLDTLVFGRQASPSDRGPPKAAEALVATNPVAVPNADPAPGMEAK